MTTNDQRTAFRIEPSSDLTATLQHGALTSPCELHNLSAGGARVSSRIRMAQGAACTLVVQIGPTSTISSTVATVSFAMHVLEAIEQADGPTTYRLHSSAPEGSPDFEAAMHLVMAAQRALLATSSGAAEASPMVSDADRRRRLRPSFRARFSKGSTRPDQHD